MKNAKNHAAFEPRGFIGLPLCLDLRPLFLAPAISPLPSFALPCDYRSLSRLPLCRSTCVKPSLTLISSDKQLISYP